MASTRWKLAIPWETHRVQFTQLSFLEATLGLDGDYPTAVGTGISLWPSAPVCFRPAVEAGLSRGFLGLLRKLHMCLLSRLREVGGGVGMTVCSLRKIFTKVVFELTAKGRAECQMCARRGSGSVCVPEVMEQAPLGGGLPDRGAVREEVAC